MYTKFKKSFKDLRSIPRRPLAKVSKLPPLLPADLTPPQSDPFNIPNSLEDLIQCLLKPIDPDLEAANPPRWPEKADENALSAYPEKPMLKND